MTDCLIIGYNEGNFPAFVEQVGLMGESSPAYRDLSLSIVWHEGQPCRAMDIVNLVRDGSTRYGSYSNGDFLWPVIAYLGSYLVARGFRFDYINLFQREKEQLREKLRSSELLTVAITTTLYISMDPIIEIISFIREHNPSVKIVVGGPYIYNHSLLLDEKSQLSLFELIDADVYVVSHEGEETLAKLLTALKAGEPLAGVGNLVYRDGDRFRRTTSYVEANSLEHDRVDYALFPPEDFGQFVSLRTAKSCPFKCAFCGYPARGGAYRYLNVEEVERELDAVKRIGRVSTVTFLDDTFNVPKKRFKEILRMMIRKDYGFRWNSYLRSDHADEECVELMAASGCEGVMLGIESGSDTVLKVMNKTARRADYLRMIPLLKDAGITVHANLIVGHPGESEATVEETVDFIRQARPHFFRAQLWYADPTTPIWKRREELGIRGASFGWEHNTMNVDRASDLIEQIFLEVDDATWLPQWGFEQWSLFYLQRRGMSLDRITGFVTAFNGAIRHRLRNPADHSLRSQDLAEMRRFCEDGAVEAS